MATATAGEEQFVSSSMMMDLTGPSNVLVSASTLQSSTSGAGSVNTALAIRNSALTTLNSIPLRPDDHSFVLTIRNHAQDPLAFCVVPQPPVITSGDTPEQMCTCVYQASLKVAAETGSAHFEFPPMLSGDASNSQDRVYVVTGTAPNGFKPNYRIHVNDHQLLRLARARDSRHSTCIMVMSDGSAPSFVKHESADSSAPDSGMSVSVDQGCVKIVIESLFPHARSGMPFVGLGRPHPFNPHDIIPTVVWPVSPGSFYTVKPGNIWHCIRASHGSGEIVDLADEIPRVMIPQLAWGARQTIHYLDRGVGQFQDSDS